MKHPEIIINNETPFETGEKSTYLRYDSLEKMLEGQVKGLGDQAKKDGEKNYQQLESLGNEAAKKIKEASKIVAKMWKISEPYMKE